MPTTTRIKEYDRDLTRGSLIDVLSNITKFVQIPVMDRVKWVGAWNAKFPRELPEAIKTIRDLGYHLGGLEFSNFRIAVPHEGKYLTSLIRAPNMPGEECNPLRMGGTMHRDPEMNICLQIPGVRIEAMPMNLEYLNKQFGESDAAAIVDWLVQTAEMRTELQNAQAVINDVVTMAKTAGQIKRMVPELLQYLPTKLRVAYEDQKRASSMPFEWAPYPKDRVERMILTVSKGHLLTNMVKPGLEGATVANIDSLMWGSYGNAIA